MLDVAHMLAVDYGSTVLSHCIQNFAVLVPATENAQVCCDSIVPSLSVLDVAHMLAVDYGSTVLSHCIQFAVTDCLVPAMENTYQMNSVDPVQMHWQAEQDP